MSGIVEVGAYHTGASPATATFADCTPYRPANFSTGLNATYPAALLNTDVGGSGGATALNWFAQLPLSEPPQFETSTASVYERTSTTGQPLYFRAPEMPRHVTVTAQLPDRDLDEGGHGEIWGELCRLAFTRSRCWVLHQKWAFSGFILSAPDMFAQELSKYSQPITFAVMYYYLPTISGSTKTYNLLSFS